jgi:RNA polymerase sigma-70 factor (ECF subfamily)
MTSKDTEAHDEVQDEAVELAEVLEGCRLGVRDAQRRLYEMRHVRIYRWAVRMVGSNDAADIVQQVFLQVFQKIGQFAGRAKFDTWLYRLATNEALQHLRKKKRWQFEPLVSDPASRHGPAERRREQREWLEAALMRVDPDLRAVFLFKEVENLSYRDIADVVGIPEGTVGSRLNRARRELQQHLVELGGEG